MKRSFGDVLRPGSASRGLVAGGGRAAAAALVVLFSLAVWAGDAGRGQTAGRWEFHAEAAERLDARKVPRLRDAAGRRRGLEEFRGRVVAVFFGFTFCADVCPTELQRLAALRRALDADGARLQVLFVTLDPERDSAADAGRYAAAFDADFLGLRGDARETAAAARAFRVFRQMIAGSAPDRYTIDHSAFVYLIDPAGRVRLRAGPELSPEQLAEDVRALLAGR